MRPAIKTWHHPQLTVPPETPEAAEHRLLTVMRDSLYAINRCIESAPALEASRLAPLTRTMRGSFYRIIREIEAAEGIPPAPPR